MDSQGKQTVPRPPAAVGKISLAVTPQTAALVRYLPSAQLGCPKTSLARPGPAGTSPLAVGRGRSSWRLHRGLCGHRGAPVPGSEGGSGSNPGSAPCWLCGLGEKTSDFCGHVLMGKVSTAHVSLAAWGEVEWRMCRERPGPDTGSAEHRHCLHPRGSSVRRLGSKCGWVPAAPTCLHPVDSLASPTWKREAPESSTD